jgi:hypothetical protein
VAAGEGAESAALMRAWSKDAEAKLRALYGRAPLARIAFQLKRTVKAVRSRAKVLRLTTGKVHRWTPAELKILRKRYPHEKTEKIARDLGLPLHKVFNAAKRAGLEKSEKYLASPDACRLRRDDNPGVAYRFPKGHVPANKGLRRPGWAPGRMATTQFKKGQRGNKWVPIGTERLNSDGYWSVKVAETKRYDKSWKAKHRILWEQAHGPVPPGHIVSFKDGNKLNCVLENLELLTMADNARRNAVWKKIPKELADLVMLRAKVQRQINKRDPRAKEETHERRKAARRALRHALRTARQGKPHGDRASESGRASR